MLIDVCREDNNCERIQELKVVIRNNRRIAEFLSSHFQKKFRKRHKEYPPFPEHIDIEVTNVCNLNCIMCPREEMKRKYQHMDWDLFRKISKELGENRRYLDRVSLHLYGEPLLQPKIYKMVSTLKGDGVPWVEFSTNCTLLDRKASENLIDCGLDEIIFAVDGANPETYRRVRVGGKFEEVVEKVREFFMLRKKMNAQKPRVRLQIIVMKETESEIRAFKKQWKPFMGKGDSFFIKKLGFYDFNRELVCDRKEGLPYRVPCELFPYKNLTIYADGRVGVCCYDWNADVTAGDVRKQDLKEIWHNNETRTFFMAHYNADFSQIPLCDKCEWTTKYCGIEPVNAMRYLYHVLIGR